MCCSPELYANNNYYPYLLDRFSSLCDRHILCRSVVLFSVLFSASHCPGYLALHESNNLVESRGVRMAMRFWDGVWRSSSARTLLRPAALVSGCVFRVLPNTVFTRNTPPGRFAEL